MKIKLQLQQSGDKRRKKKEKKFQKTLQNKSKSKNNVFTESLLSRVLSHSGSQSPPSFPRMPSIAVLISGPAVGATLI